MQLDFAMLADGVTPRQDGKFDIFGAGWDTIFAGSVPARHARLVLAVRLLISRTEAEHPHTLSVIIQGADGGEIARAVGQCAALPPEQRQQISLTRRAGVSLVMNFDDLVFPEFGAYQVVIQWDGNEARPPLQLILAQAAQP